MSLANRNRKRIQPQKNTDMFPIKQSDLLRITPVTIGNKTWYQYECMNKCKRYKKRCNGFINLKTDKKPENADDIIQCFWNQHELWSEV